MSYKFALEQYIKHPESNSVLYYDDDFVVINDAYPKGAVHYLVMPRDGELTKRHPLEAFNDDKLDLYSKIKPVIDKTIERAAKRLAEIKGHAKDDGYYQQYIKVGVHSKPSLVNLHVHVISRDMYSDRMKRPNHYTSFNTRFFVPFDSFAPSEEPFHPLGYLNGDKFDKDMDQLVRRSDLVCWRCNRNFKRSFSLLKKHLEEEFKAL